MVSDVLVFGRKYLEGEITMSHSEVMKWFENYFPDYSGDRIDVWFPNGRNSIRIRQKNGQEFIFTYHSQKDWRFETITSFLNGMKGGKK